MQRQLEEQRQLECNFDNVKLVCFGSIYVAHYRKVRDINLLNYMSRSDVAIKTNWLGSRFTRKSSVGSFFKVLPSVSYFTKSIYNIINY